MNSVILRAGTRYLAGLLLLVSLFMLLRGHNEPGGGFIGGLIGATGFVLYAIAWGTEQARAALRLSPQNIAMAGLGIALLAGLFASVFGDPLFTVRFEAAELWGPDADGRGAVHADLWQRYLEPA